jgi:hypothetical protein
MGTVVPGVVVSHRSALAGVFMLALKSPWRETVPAFGADFPTELAACHAVMMEKRPDASPGEFKLEPNRAGGT